MQNLDTILKFELSQHINLLFLLLTSGVHLSKGSSLVTFDATGLFLYPLKTPENLWFSDVLNWV